MHTFGWALFRRLRKTWNVAGAEILRGGGGGPYREYFKKLSREGKLKGRRRNNVFHGVRGSYYALPPDEMETLRVQAAKS